jgi:two-component system LytT family sensor kinase
VYVASLDTRARWVRWGAFLAGLSALSFFTMVQLLIGYWGKGRPLGVFEAFLSGVATWFPWAIFAPIIDAIWRRYPFEGRIWRRSIVVHLLATPVIGVAWGVVRWGASFTPFIDPMPLELWWLLMSHFPLWFLSYWVLVTVRQATHNYQRFREREVRASQLETKLAQAQLEMLKMQLHPHFLFNTLHAISTLIHRDPDAADEMVAQLSDLLRMTLATIGIQEVPLQQELEFLQRYLEIQKTRFQDRLEVILDIPPETLDVHVPNQVLQPIVENAIRHGIDARSGQGLIAIRARTTEHMLELTVRDDGPGLKADVNLAEQPADNAPRDGRGIGLANTRARLRELYGPASTLHLGNHPDGGAIVTLSLPIRRVEPSVIEHRDPVAASPVALSAPPPTLSMIGSHKT